MYAIGSSQQIDSPFQSLMNDDHQRRSEWNSEVRWMRHDRDRCRLCADLWLAIADPTTGTTARASRGCLRVSIIRRRNGRPLCTTRDANASVPMSDCNSVALHDVRELHSLSSPNSEQAIRIQKGYLFDGIDANTEESDNGGWRAFCFEFVSVDWYAEPCENSAQLIDG